ncbi:MAG TPA: FG-GAP-like repeat-containing protein [Nocardioides sp.]|nr:FG-GAP-like repeat-containing protein [Nocardioides sp.]
MQPSQARFVTVCQQFLALGVVLAVLTPAAAVISLDIVPDRSSGSAVAPAVPMAAYARAATVPSRVPAGAVDAEVEEYSLTAPTGARIAPGRLKARAVIRPSGASEVTSRPMPVTGYGAIGVTWQPGRSLADDDIAVQARTSDGTGWSDWTDVEYHDDHGPDPGSAEAAHSRPGTEPLLVGDVDEVQVRVATDDAAPSDLKLAVIDPGQAPRTARELPAIDTAALGGEDEVEPAAVTTDGTDGLALSAATYTPKPKIYSRAQWGANERLRDKGSLHYFEVHAGFVHHTVNANDYTRAQVPGILRSIYAYHTQSRGWSDVGYNFLVDRFGRMWEGRFGGVDRPVVGAHTLGYNDNAFAMSAIGNFELRRPSKAMLQAYGALFAWKLSLHGIAASSQKQFVSSRNFKAINGHRDAASTACPGKYLYARIPQIRRLAAQLQKGWKGRQLESDLAGSGHPDLIVRRASDGMAFVLPIRPTPTSYKVGKPIATGFSLKRISVFFNAGDWDRDRHSDLMFRSPSNGALYLKRGLGTGKFAPAKRVGSGFAGVRLLAAVGDMTGDGWPDLMGQPRGGAMRIYPGKGVAGFKRSYVAHAGINAYRQIPIGLWNPDGAPDSLFRTGAKVSLYQGNGPGGLMRGRQMGIDLGGFDWSVGVSDVGLTGHADLIVRKKGTGKLYLLQGSTRGFARPVLLGSGMGIYDKAS